MREAVLVSGGAGGIGRHVVTGLHARGWLPLIGFASSGDVARQLAQQVGGLALKLDLEEIASIEAAVEQIARLSEPLAAVILAASPPPNLSPFTRLDQEEALKQWRVNVLGPRLLLAGLVKRCLRVRRRGTIVAVLTAAMGDEARPPADDMADYVIAKYGLAGLMRVVGAEYSWLRAVTVAPGFVETAMLSAFDERWLDAVRKSHPDGKFIAPETVAQEICELIGDPRDS